MYVYVYIYIYICIESSLPTTDGSYSAARCDLAPKRSNRTLNTHIHIYIYIYIYTYIIVIYPIYELGTSHLGEALIAIIIAIINTNSY